MSRDLFCVNWSFLCLLDPDPETQMNPDPIRIRNTAYDTVFTLFRQDVRIHFRNVVLKRLLLKFPPQVSFKRLLLKFLPQVSFE